MVFVDSSVWIDLIRGSVTLETEALVGLVRRNKAVVGDLVMAEVLQGLEIKREFNATLTMFKSQTIIIVGGEAATVEAARNFQTLRRLGITVRKTIDTLIATRCIMDSYPLLYSDRDFDPFVEHLGLKSAMA